jgi:transcriptional regulator with XRE-family HTH domain
MANRALFRARKAAGLTLEKLSAATGISHPQLSWFESGKRFPRVIDLEKIAAVLCVPIESLIESATHPVPHPPQPRPEETPLGPLDRMLEAA